jgi:hypothetical protein
MNRDSDDDSNQSLGLLGEPKLADIPDLVNLIADYCDDAALSKLSRVLNIHFNINITTDKQRCPQDDY